MVQKGVSVGALAYNFRSSRSSGAAAKERQAGEDRTHPAAAATFAAGLRPGVLNVDERHRFLGKTGEYLEAR